MIARKIFVVCILVFTIVLLLFPNINTTGTIGNQEATSPWVISNVTYVFNQTITLNTSLTILSSGNLTFYNVTLLFDCSKDGEFGIDVETNGRFYCYNSSITALNPSHRYSFSVHGKIVMDFCNITHTQNGIMIWSSDVLIANSIIQNSGWNGIEIWEASPLIYDNFITNNKMGGITCSSNSRPEIGGNIISNNSMHGIFCYAYSHAVICNNKILNNKYGICCTGSSPTIRNCTISSTNYDFYILHNSHPTVINTSFDETKVLFEDYHGTIELPGRTLRKDLRYDILLTIISAMIAITMGAIFARRFILNILRREKHIYSPKIGWDGLGYFFVLFSIFSILMFFSSTYVAITPCMYGIVCGFYGCIYLGPPPWLPILIIVSSIMGGICAFILIGCTIHRTKLSKKLAGLPDDHSSIGTVKNKHFILTITSGKLTMIVGAMLIPSAYLWLDYSGGVLVCCFAVAIVPVIIGCYVFIHLLKTLKSGVK